MLENRLGLGLYIKKQRKDNNISMLNLACHVGVSISYLSRLENGSMSLTLNYDKIDLIANAIGIDLYFIDNFLYRNSTRDSKSWYYNSLSDNQVTRSCFIKEKSYD